MSGLRELKQSAHALLLRWLARLSRRRVGYVIVYHRVGGSSGDPKVDILPAVADADFERQLRHLRRHYRVVPAARILEATRNRRRGQSFPVAVTFDDDLASHVRVALPALREAGVPATFFLGGSSLQGAQSFWWEDLQRAIDGRLVRPDEVPHVVEAEVRAALEREPRAIFRVADAIERLDPAKRSEVATALRATVGQPVETGLRAADVQALGTGNCDVGFHTLRHEPLPDLSNTELERALDEGRQPLAAAGASRLDLIAYPHGKADQRVAAAARSAGFNLGFTTARQLVEPDTDPLLIPRIPPALSSGRFALRLARAFASAA